MAFTYGNANRNAQIDQTTGYAPAQTAQPQGMGTRMTAAQMAQQRQIAQQAAAGVNQMTNRAPVAPIARDIAALQKTYPNMQDNTDQYRYFADDAKRAGLPAQFSENIYMSGWPQQGMGTR